MTYEVEKKFIVSDLNKVKELLRQMGETIGPVTHITDIYFSHPARDFSRTDEAFRFRQVGESNYLTYKGPRVDDVNSTRARKENEIALLDGQDYADQMIDLWKSLGFRVVTCVRKHRSIASLSRQDVVIDVALDQVEKLGAFVEVEVIADQTSNVKSAQQVIASVAHELELTQGERLSYSELMMRLQ